MKTKRLNYLLSLSAGMAMAMFAAPAFGQTVTTLLIDDDFGDGVGGNTGTVTEVAEANFFTTSSGAGIDNSLPVAGGGFRFISGTSGRAIHTLFSPTSLATVGDRIDVSFDFTTPASVQSDGVGNDEEFRFGLFDTSNATGVNLFTGQNTTTGAAGTDTGTPINFNSNISSATNNNQPGLLLRGFTSEIDIEADNDAADISFRVSAIDGPAPDANNPPSGRLTTTTNGFDSLGSGPDFGFLSDVDGDGVFDAIDGDTVNTIDPLTAYTATLSIELLANGDYQVTSSVAGGNLTAANTLATDIIFADLAASTAAGSSESVLGTGTFDLLTFAASGAAFGTINSSDADGDGVLDDDNGITFTSLSVTSTIAAAIPEPSSLALLGLLGCAGLVRRRR